MMSEDEFWEEVIRCNTEAFNRRNLKQFYKEKWLMFRQSLPWYVRLYCCYYAWIRRGRDDNK
jgi:hypothetical protein